MRKLKIPVISNIITFSHTSGATIGSVSILWESSGLIFALT